MKKGLTNTEQRLLKIGQKIKQMRLDKGESSYEAFAWKNEINRVQYHRIESGSNITIATLLKVLDIHNISLNEFFRDIE